MEVAGFFVLYHAHTLKSDFSPGFNSVLRLSPPSTHLDRCTGIVINEKTGQVLSQIVEQVRAKLKG